MTNYIFLPRMPVVVFVIALLVYGTEDSTAQFHLGQCPRSGRQCNGCQIVEDCVQHDGLFVIGPAPVETCDGYDVCDASQDVPRCVTDATCRYKQFTCPPGLEKEEVFPDPYSCVEYHVCKDGQPIDHTCGRNQIFDPRERRCVAGDGEGCTGPPVPLCDEVGTVWSIPGTDYEYICTEEWNAYRILYPRVTLKVEVKEGDDNDPASTSTTDVPSTSTTNDQSTSTTNDQSTTTTAVPSTSTTNDQSTSTAKEQSTTTTDVSSTSTTNDQSTSTTKEQSTTTIMTTTEEQSTTESEEQSTTTTEESSTMTTEEPSTVKTTTTVEPSPCTNGVGAYPVPGDCRKYYLCYLLPNNSLGYVERMCRRGSHFDGYAGRCVAGSCSEYPSTTTAVPTPTPVHCESNGVLEDKKCCKCYYICFDNGSGINYVHKCCRKGSHFDPGKKVCVAGDMCTPMDNC